MKKSIRNVALWALLVLSVLLPATRANAACTFQSIAYGQTVSGSLSATDCTDDLNGFSYYADYYRFTGSAGDKVTLQLSSSSFDPWLVLYFPSGNYTNNDNGGGGTSARIPATSGYYTLPENGIYKIEVTSYASHSTGNYTLDFAKEENTTTLPSAPINVTATAGNGSATVSFTPSSIGSGTLVDYWAACGIDSTHLTYNSGSNSPITVLGLVNGTAYYCWALTRSTVGDSHWSTVSNTVTPTSIAATSVPVTEFYNTNLDNYFITADANEASAIDSGSAGPGWSRTGNTFKSGGNTPVCRFYGSLSPGPNSHFYTVDPGECASLKQLQASTPATQSRWNFESLAFVSTPSTNGTCPGGTVPVYRAYNNGYARGVDSNHRITSNPTAIQQQLACGWSNEGVVMCAPSGTSSGGTTSCGGGGDGTVFTLITNPTSGQIFSAKKSDGTIFRYFGRRDADGIPTEINNIQVASAGEKTTQIELDSTNRPAKIRSPDGVAFNLTYVGNRATVTAVAPDGLTNVSTSFTFGTASTVLPSDQVATHSNNKSSINEMGTVRLPLVVTAASPAVGTQQSDWGISVNKCGVPFDDAFLAYNITGLDGAKLIQYGPANHIGVGKWVASIPTNIRPPLNESMILKAAQNLEWIFGADAGICNIVGGVPNPELILASMCPAIAVALTPITGPGGVAIGSACAVGSAAVIGYCKTLGAGGPPGGDSIMKKLLEGLKDQQTPPDNFSLQAVASTYKKAGLSDDFSIPLTVKASGPFSPTTISVTDPDVNCTPVVAPIAITSISPTTGPVGATVTITGKGFGTTVGTITFNGTAATATSWSDTLIKTTVPTGATTGNVLVKNKATAGVSNGMVFTIGSTNGGSCTALTREQCACDPSKVNYICAWQLADPGCDPDLICPY